MADKFFWFDSSDNVAVGDFSTEDAARKCAEESAGYEDGFKRYYTIVKVVSTSAPPSLKRKWKTV